MKKFILLAFSLMFSVVSFAATAFDVIITSDARKIEAKILEVSKTEIKYKESSNLDGPTFILATDEISSIIYSNGSVAVFENAPKKEEPKAVNNENEVTILTRKGEAIKGRLIRISDEALTYEANGVEYTLFANQIDKVAMPDGQVKSYDKSSAYGSSKGQVKTLYQTYLELSGNVGTYNYNNSLIGAVQLHSIHGARFNKYVFVGGGFGLCSSFADSYYGRLIRFSIPLYADLRTYVPTRTEGLYPYFGVSVGPNFVFYSIYDGSSYADFAALGYFRLYTGLDYKRFTFGVGYELWGNADEVEHMALFKIGVRLGKNPY